jgi:hypothetical protein
MIKLKQLILEKTLYHGTIINNVPSIEKYGLMPSVGEFVKDAYDMTGYEGLNPDDYLKELVFATDKEQLDKAVTAITAQISKKLNKSFHSVTDEEFIHYGAIVKIYDGDSVLERRPPGDENYYGEYPHTVEPGDYYSSNYVGVDDILTGHRMIRLLKRYNAWPRIYPLGGGNEKWLRDRLIKLGLKYHSNKDKEKVIKAVMSLPTNNLIKNIGTYEDLVKKKLNEIYKGGIPRFLYHATVWELTPSIFKKGLLPKGTKHHMYENNDYGVYMSSDKQFSIEMVESADERSSNIPEEWFNDIVVLFIDTHKLSDKKLFRKDPHINRERKKEPQSFLYEGKVPPYAIVRMEDQNGRAISMYPTPVLENINPNLNLKSEVEKLESDLKQEFSQIEYLHIYIKSDGEELFINSIHIKPDSQGKGYGGQIMDRIINFADLHGLYITLKPEPESGHKADLMRFYKRFGFRPNKGRYGISKYGGAFGLYLIRPPKSKQMVK